MHASLTLRAYAKWQRYWEEEPWGPWRDNLHIAVLAREMRRPQQRPLTSISLEQFFYRTPDRAQTNANENLWNMLKAISKPEPAK